jgi:hypothetical protein
MLSWILFTLAFLALVGMSYVAWRFYRKAVMYDTILTHINDDVIANIRQFDRMNKSSVLGNDAEIQEAHRLMIHMGRRLNEISNQMEEASGLKLRPKPIGPRPVVE